MINPIQDSLVNLQKANQSLRNAVGTLPRNAVIVSAIVKNFEFNFELSWKAMKRLLSHHGLPTTTPRQAISETFRKGFIDSESTWLAMIEDRNLTVHTYDEAFALEMATRIESEYLPLFDSFLSCLTKEVANI
jgi:nucleotidyltransferase substrate binding protein (TIGR01987 family)